MYDVARCINYTAPARYGYIENKGQIVDQNNQYNPYVKYLFNSNGLNIELRENGFSFDTYSVDKELEYHFHRVDIEFIGANNHPELTAEFPSADYINYYTTGTPEGGVKFVRTFKTVTYKNLYKGIDLEFTVDDTHRPKYNFIVHEGADLSLLIWKYNGAFATALREGKIMLNVEQGIVEEKLPISYIKETGQKIEAKYYSAGDNMYGIAVARHNANTTLVIDPIPWATYFGGASGDEAWGTATDIQGNIIVSGRTSSTSAIATTGAYQTVNGGGSSAMDAFILKLSSAGSILWATYYGGSGSDYSTDVATDRWNNIYVTGGGGLATSNSYQTSMSGGSDAFLARFDTAGMLVWSTYFGGNGGDLANSVSTDKFGNVVITGYTTSTSGLATTGAFSTTFGGGAEDAFACKFTPAGNLRWATYFGGGNNERGYGIAADTSGNIITVGRTSSTSGISTTGAFQVIYGGGAADAYVVKFDSAGGRLWSTYYGIDLYDLTNCVATDNRNNIIIGGYTTSGASIPSPGAHQVVFGGGTFYGDAMIVKFEPNGNRAWATYYGGSGDDQVLAVTTDTGCNIYAGGCTLSSSAIATAGVGSIAFAGGSTYGDGFVVKLNPFGVRQWGTYYGGTLDDCVRGVESSYNGNVVIAGITYSASAMVFGSAYQPVYGGVYDAFIASLNSGGGLPVNLLSFTAQQKNDNVLLKWQTASEENNERFEVERNVHSSESTADTWENIGKVKGNGTSTTLSNYEFTDNLNTLSPKYPHIIYYRLKQFDFDGKFTYSNVCAINSENVTSSITLSPNPVEGNMIILCNGKDDGMFLVEIYDMLGVKLIVAELTKNENTISVRDLPNGIYVCKVQTSGKTNSIKFFRK